MNAAEANQSEKNDESILPYIYNLQILETLIDKKIKAVYKKNVGTSHPV